MHYKADGRSHKRQPMMNNGVERNQCSVERSRVESRSKTNYNSESSKIVNEIIIEEFHPLLLFFFF